MLRYGGFYGPGHDAQRRPGGRHSVAIRKRQFPVVGDGGGVWSFIHVDDAAAATVLAVERGGRGIYNVVDDEPAPGARVDAGAGPRARRQAAAARAALARRACWPARRRP